MDPILPAIGVFMTLFFHYFFLYLGRRQDRSNLFYSLFCLSIISMIYIMKIYPESTIYGPRIYNSLKVINCAIICIILTYFAYTIFDFSRIKKISLVLIGALLLFNIFFIALYFIVQVDIFCTLLYYVLILYIITQSIFMIIQIVLLKQYKERNHILIMTGYFAFLVQGIWFLVLEGIMRKLTATIVQRPGTIIMIVLFTYVLMENYNRQYHNLLDLKVTLEGKVEERTHQLLLVNRKKSKFFINLAHEIKTPLTLISNYFEKFIEINGYSSETKVIRRNVDKLIRDIVNILSIEKLESGNSGFDHSQVSDLSEIIRQKVTLFKGIAGTRKIKIKTDLQNNAYTRIDPTALDIIINNLLDNAIKYNKENGHITIRLRNKEENRQYLELMVEDNGIGMDKDKLGNIFNQFYQVSHVKRSYEGLGIGLALVKSVLNDIGSEILVESEKNIGTRFYVLFKSCKPSINDIILKESGNYQEFVEMPDGMEIPETPYKVNRQTVLIIEDNTEMLSFLAEQISIRYNIFAVLSGYEALEKLKTIPRPDLIISDIMMDGINGIQFFKLLNQDKIFSSIPFVFLTAKTGFDEELSGLKEGAVDFIKKPFSIHVLMAKIDAILNNREKQKNLMMEEMGEKIYSFLQNYNSEILSSQTYQKSLNSDDIIISHDNDFNMSPRELEVIGLIGKGFLYKEIAIHLNLSMNTIETYRKRIFKKCNIQNKMELLNIFTKEDKLYNGPRNLVKFNPGIH